MQIVVKDLNEMDEISIRTRHSEYRFRVTHPALCKGFLSGGLLGEEHHEAVLTGACVPQQPETYITTKLEIGGCALFYVANRERLNCLSTSVIDGLELVEVHGDNSEAAEC